ncbi:hypothetical protein PED39_05370 [Methanomassiliicoccales archaeon LGM-RCC1]|nr:hypothetical protein PED39_05370 [Methanomassiliicoccales archaeon LGM-RCC1]
MSDGRDIILICPHCGNRMYPSEDEASNHLFWTCEACELEIVEEWQ